MNYICYLASDEMQIVVNGELVGIRKKAVSSYFEAFA
jgi:hypothetical protein